MLPNPHYSADLVTFTEEIFHGKLDFLCSTGQQRHETFVRTYPAVTYFRNLKSKQNLFQNKTIKKATVVQTFFTKRRQILMKLCCITLKIEK